MCKIHNPRVIDECMRKIIKFLNINRINTLACCCGHGRYPMSIIVNDSDLYNIEIFSGKVIPRKRKFYKKDSKGYYYIPEIVKEKR